MHENLSSGRKPCPTKFDALVSILNWMESGQSVTPQYIQEQLVVSERTTYRSMQTLEGAGFPIHFDKRKGTYRFTEGYSLRKPNLTVSETLALMLARMSLKGSGIGLDSALDLSLVAECASCGTE